MTITTQIPMLCPACKRAPSKPGKGFCSPACEASVEPSVAEFWHFSAAAWIEMRAVREYRRAKDGLVPFQ